MGIATITTQKALAFLHNKYSTRDINVKQIEYFIQNKRREKTSSKTEFELLQSFLKTTPEVTWHWLEEDSKGIAHFGVVLTTPYLSEVRKQYGAKVIGLDSVWKWTKLRIPIWLLVVDTVAYGGIVVAIIVSTSGCGDTLGEALAHIFGDEPPSKFMIEHDEAERVAVQSINVSKNVFKTYT